MNERDRELEAFSKFIGALEPWLGEVVLIGGWAHRLYRHHPLARRLAYLPLITLDGDVAVPPKLKGRKLSVRKRLLDAGFVEEFVGEDWPPATHYHYGKGGGFYAEFLSPLVGSEYDRRGKRKATQEVGGISSQLLRYIEILMISPWKVQLGRENGYPFSPKRKVQIANPTSFLAMKTACIKTALRTSSIFTTRSSCFPRAWKNCGISSKRMSLRNSIHEEERNSKALPTNCSEKRMTRFARPPGWPRDES